MSSPSRVARAAGVLYLLMAILGGYAHLGVRNTVYTPGDAATTTANIVGNPTLFRVSLVADLAMAILFVSVGVALHRLLRHVDLSAAGAMVLFVTVGAAMILTNLLFHQAALLVATDASVATSLGVEAADALTLFLLDLHQVGYTLAGIFFGLWLLPLSYLAVRSRMFPRLLGVALGVAGVAWIVDTVVRFAAPELPGIFRVALEAPRFAEFALILYLLIRGVRTPAPAITEPAVVA